MTLSVMKLSFAYGRDEVLKDVSFSLEQGEIVALLGPNGTGKTTLLRAVNGILRSSKGTVLLDGRSMGSCPRRERAKLFGYVPQRDEPQHLTVFDAVLLGRRPPIAVALVAAGVVIGARYLPRNRPVAEGPSAGPAPTSEAPPSETPSASADASARTSATATASASSTATTTMPDLVGLTADQAKAKLPGNVKVDVVKANAPHGEKEGTVLSTDPAAGEKISDTVTLTVAGSATSSSTSGSTKTVYLADIKATEQVNTDVFDLNGKSQVHGFTKIFYSASQWSTEWNLGRHFNTMSGTIGITDNSKDSGATFTVEFYLDQELVQTETLAFGEFKDISLNVQNKLRLKVVITRTDKGSRTASVGFGDFQLQGDSDKVPSLDDLNKGN